MAIMPINRSHQSGMVHQSGSRLGEKSESIRTKTRLGSAISRARGDNRPRVASGSIFFLMIQNPTIPIPSKITTDSNVMVKISMGCFASCRYSLYLAVRE